jgi:hypothetical protein
MRSCHGGVPSLTTVVTQLCAILLKEEENLMATSSERRRAHVVMSVELVREIDALVGRRGRSQFLEEAAAERLQRLRRVEAFERAIATPTKGIPEWESRESAEDWVRELRQGWEERLQQGASPETS